MNSKEALNIVRYGGVGYTEKEFYEAENIIEKDLEALEIIKERFVWIEDDLLYCGRMNDISILIDEEVEGKEEMNLLKEVLDK